MAREPWCTAIIRESPTLTNSSLWMAKQPFCTATTAISCAQQSETVPLPTTYRYGWPGSQGVQQSLERVQHPRTHRFGWPGSPDGRPREKRNKRCPAPYRDRVSWTRRIHGWPRWSCWSLWRYSCLSLLSSHWSYFRSRCSWILKQGSLWACIVKEKLQDKWCLKLKGPLTKGFCADSWNSEEFLIIKRERMRELINVEQRWKIWMRRAVKTRVMRAASLYSTPSMTGSQWNSDKRWVM